MVRGQNPGKFNLGQHKSTGPEIKQEPTSFYSQPPTPIQQPYQDTYSPSKMPVPPSPTQLSPTHVPNIGTF